MFGSDSDRGDVSGVVRFEQSDHEAGHRSTLDNDAIRNGFGGGQQVFKSIPAISFAINETTLIETPTFVDLRNGQRPHVITRVDWRDQDDI